MNFEKHQKEGKKGISILSPVPLAITPMILRETLLGLRQLFSKNICTEDTENSKALRMTVSLVYWQP